MKLWRLVRNNMQKGVKITHSALSPRGHGVGRHDAKARAFDCLGGCDGLTCQGLTVTTPSPFLSRSYCLS